MSFENISLCLTYHAQEEAGVTSGSTAGDGAEEEESNTVGDEEDGRGQT